MRSSIEIKSEKKNMAAKENSLWRRVISGKHCERIGLHEVNVRPLKRERDNFYVAVKAINAMESLRLLPARYE